MKLSPYAKQLGISYSTAWRMWKRGEIAGYQLASGTVIVNQSEQESRIIRKVAIYARISNSEHKKNLDTQAERLVAWCTLQGWSVVQVVKECGSGVNDQRPRFLALLADPSITHIVVEHKERASRFGVAYIQTLLAVQKRELVVVNSAPTAEEDLMSDLLIQDHASARILYEDLSVASMRFKVRSVNAYLYASNLAHIPEQIKWATAKRGMAAHTVKAAYSSQECSRCHYVDRANRPNQQTFCCVRCGYQDHADHNAALNLASRWGDQELAACQKKDQVKALLLRRHEECKQLFGLAVVQPAVQLGLWDDPPASTDVA